MYHHLLQPEQVVAMTIIEYEVLDETIEHYQFIIAEDDICYYGIMNTC